MESARARASASASARASASASANQPACEEDVFITHPITQDKCEVKNVNKLDEIISKTKQAFYEIKWQALLLINGFIDYSKTLETPVFSSTTTKWSKNSLAMIMGEATSADGVSREGSDENIRRQVSTDMEYVNSFEKKYITDSEEYFEMDTYVRYFKNISIDELIQCGWIRLVEGDSYMVLPDVELTQVELLYLFNEMLKS